MKKQAGQVPIDINLMPDYDPRAILEQAGVDYDSIGAINADGIAVSQDVADAWREQLGDEFDLIGPRVDLELPEGTAAVFQDQLEAGGEGQASAEAEDGEQEEAAQGAYRVGEENAGDGESKDMLPGAAGSRRRGPVSQRNLMRRARVGKKGPRDYHQSGDKARQYNLTDWFDFESEISGSGSSEFLGREKDKKEKKT